MSGSNLACCLHLFQEPDRAFFESDWPETIRLSSEITLEETMFRKGFRCLLMYSADELIRFEEDNFSTGRSPFCRVEGP